MKKVALILFMFMGLTCYSQKFELVEINADWNLKNGIKIKRVEGISIKFARLEDQPTSLQSSVKSVPTLLLFKNNKIVRQWQAGIDFKLTVTEEDIKKELKRQREYEKN